ncbi:hypothetical protein BDY21DRAFT_302199 [Lineolata rhizophorae]|uniref:SPRY domain-containing protein n=1 Tax=Lineolata rhizophorae TaxID=578093 RepID=A0A6A6P2T4_9PEZI|nr:hypothetical protein BDY21DRAFT_302199 [Lineolata rhizophorae]
MAEQYQPPPGPPPGHRSQYQSSSEFAPPPGPPPGHSGHHLHQQQQTPEIYAPPPGPPPSHRQQQEETYAPPPGPPPSHAQQTYAPPPGPPPSRQPASSPSQPYHDWQSIPDPADLPPPPSLTHHASPTGNASLAAADAAHAWTASHPLWEPRALAPEQREAMQAGALVLSKPREYVGDVLQKGRGHWFCRTWRKCPEACLLSTLPLYAAAHDSPLRSGRERTVYFELQVLGVGGLDDAEAGIAIGFVAPPYPTWRLPGWERASLGVHGDDGRRYVNDTFGGIDFTAPFRPGQRVGIGMTFAAPPPAYSESGKGVRMMEINVFFTRDGRREGGWDLHEELDERVLEGTMGLEGECDLLAAIGVFGGVDFEVFFSEDDWWYKPK